MTLEELYQQTPVSQHSQIKVSGDRVFVVGSDGVQEYLLRSGGELELARSDKEVRQVLQAIKAKLGV